MLEVFFGYVQFVLLYAGYWPFCRAAVLTDGSQPFPAMQLSRREAAPSPSSFKSPTLAVLGLGIRRGSRQQQKALIQKAMKRVLFSLFSVLVLMALHSREVHPVTSWLLPQMVPPKPAHRRRGRLPARLQDALSQRPGVLSRASPPVQIPHSQAVFLVAFPLLVLSRLRRATTLFALPCPAASHRFALPHRKLFTSAAHPWQVWRLTCLFTRYNIDFPQPIVPIVVLTRRELPSLALLNGKCFATDRAARQSPGCRKNQPSWGPHLPAAPRAPALAAGSGEGNAQLF